METYTDKIENGQSTLSDSSGLFLFSDPSNYTGNISHGPVLLRISYDMERVSKALDDLSDEIGTTHEIVTGKISENNEE